MTKIVENINMCALCKHGVGCNVCAWNHTSAGGIFISFSMPMRHGAADDNGDYLQFFSKCTKIFVVCSQ